MTSLTQKVDFSKPPARVVPLAELLTHSYQPGLGDRAHAMLGPVGRKIGWPCLKGDGSTELKPNSLCGFLRQTLNRIG